MQHALIVVWLGIACALSSTARLARAADGQPLEMPGAAATRVVLIASPGMDDLVLRFVAELHSLRLEVMRAPDTETAPDLLDLGRLAQAHDARVAVRVSRAGPAVDLWLVNQQSKELVYRRVMAEGDPAVLVLRSLEILRGALIDLGMAAEYAAPPEPPAPATSPPLRPISRAAPILEPSSWIGLSGALLAPHAGSSLGAGAALSLHRRLDSRFALRADVLAPVGAWGVSGEGGRATIWLGMATIAGVVSPWGDRTFSPGLGLGVGVLGLRVRGDAETAYRGTSSLNAALFPHARAEVALRLAARLRLRGALAAGFATPRPVLLFAAKREESWLNPLLISTLGVEVALP